MKTKVIWAAVICMMVSCWVVVDFVSASSCQAQEKPETPRKEKAAHSKKEKPTAPGGGMVKLSLEKLDGTVVEKMVEEPRYGGVFTQALSVTPSYFDDAFGHKGWCPTNLLTCQGLLEADWTRGPAGTGEISLQYAGLFCPQEYVTGALAESWELADSQTIVLHIRKGVHFHDKPPTSGREMTSDDVAFSLNRLWQSPKSIHYQMYPFVESITAPDKWTVLIKSKLGKTGAIYEFATQHSYIVPREAVEKYGDLTDWRNNCGTGPFMLVDYIENSVATFVRNPNYWRKDPLHPENRLPYADGAKQLVIADTSTQLSALRTGKVDQLYVDREQAALLKKTNPGLRYARLSPSAVTAIYPRVDKPELPFKDKRIRRAMMMALDNQSIVSSLYGGEAELLAWPVPNIAEFKGLYTPVDQLPQSTREVFEYHPERAKQLLAEAGYPNGFKTSVVCYQAHVDVLSIVKEYWAKIGVDLAIDVKEYSVYHSMGIPKTFSEMYVFSSTSTLMPHKMPFDRSHSPYNFGMNQDQVIMQTYDDVMDAYFDTPKRTRILKEYIPYTLDQCYLLLWPAPYSYNFWQPWVKGYHGEANKSYNNVYDYPEYIWIDQNLKEKPAGNK